MDRVNSYGPMVPNTKVNGAITRLTAKGSFGMQMGIFTKESGKTIRPMDTESISTQTEQGTRVTGRMICKTDSALRPGPMVHATKASIRKARSMEKANMFGTMGPDMTDTGLKTRSMVEESMNGLMEEDMKGNGKITICMGRVYTLG